MFKTFIAAFFTAILIFIIYLLIHLGAFKAVEIQITQAPEMILLFKEHVGPYHKIVPIIEEVEAWAKSKGIDCSQSFGEYLDDPDSVEEARLRSRGGCVLKSDIPEYPLNFKKLSYPSRKSVKALFEGSPSIGPWKVYPKMISYMSEARETQKGPMLEIYFIKSEKEMTTTYLLPLE